MNERMIDARWCRKRSACYTDRRLASLFDRPMTLLEVLTRRDGPWKRVPAKDRLWPFFIAAPRAAKAAVVNRAADRQVRAHCLHCGIKTVERWAARWLSGEDRSAALAWASASRAARAAEEASWAAGRAPRAAAKAAAATARAALPPTTPPPPPVPPATPTPTPLPLTGPRRSASALPISRPS